MNGGEKVSGKRKILQIPFVLQLNKIWGWKYHNSNGKLKNLRISEAASCCVSANEWRSWGRIKSKRIRDLLAQEHSLILCCSVAVFINSIISQWIGFYLFSSSCWQRRTESFSREQQTTEKCKIINKSCVGAGKVSREAFLCIWMAVGAIYEPRAEPKYLENLCEDFPLPSLSLLPCRWRRGFRFISLCGI